jgi:hypothetical protein
MGEDQNKSDEDRFEDGLRQILSNSPPPGTAGGPLRRQARPDGAAPLTAAGKADTEIKAEAESKALFLFKLLRVLAIPALLVFFAKFIMRITAAQ